MLSPNLLVAPVSKKLLAQCNCRLSKAIIDPTVHGKYFWTDRPSSHSSLR